MTPAHSIGYRNEAAQPSARTIAASLDQIAFFGLCVLAFGLPWERGTGFTILPLVGGATGALAILSSAISPRQKKLWDLHYWLIAFAAWSAMSLLWTVDWDATLTRAATYGQLMVFAWLIWVLASTESRIFRLMQAYLFGTFVCAYGTFMNLLAGRTYGQTADLEGTNSSRYIMTGMNPNDVGLLLAPALAISLYLLARRKGNPLILWIQFVMCITTILLSGSRGGLLASAVALVMFPMVFGALRRWQKLFAAVACAGAIAAAVYFVPPDTWQRLLRVGTDLTQGTMTHRTQIWAGSMELFREHPLLGVGSDAHAAAVVKIVARPLVAHNTFLSVLVELGVAGELIFLGLIACAFEFARRIGSLERTFWTLLLAGWCIGAVGGTWEYRKATWFLFGLLAAHVYVRRRNNLCAESPAS